MASSGPMRLVPALALSVAPALWVACGDNTVPPDPNAPATILAELQALPDVHDVTQESTSLPGYSYFVLHFTQPVDHRPEGHADPTGATFLEEVSLLHRDVAAPLVIQTSGYWDYYLDSPVELTQLLGANQISIEHRFFGSSRPEPADWSKLTIEQMADDEHAIVEALGQIYGGPKLATGGSKGGMTAVFYRRFFPDDVDGTVPYVAPISFAAPDPRYPAYLDDVGTAECRAAVRALAVELLQNRRDAMVAAATAEAAAHGYTYTRIAIGPAVESAIVSLEWTFWQYYGIDACSAVPAVTGSDGQLWTFLDEVSPVDESDDVEVAAFEPYVYQAYFQLGYPDDGTEDWLAPYELYSGSDYTGYLPVGVPAPAYDGGSAMTDIQSWLETDGRRFLFEYGEWDPWSGGRFALGSAADSAIYVAPEGTHDSELANLGSADEGSAFASLAAWTGVEPSRDRARRLAVHHVLAPHVRVPRLRGHGKSP